MNAKVGKCFQIKHVPPQEWESKVKPAAKKAGGSMQQYVRVAINERLIKDGFGPIDWSKEG